MFKTLLVQVLKLFSSKTNGARLVSKSTDRLHDCKQVIFGFSISLLLGYSVFRTHYSCNDHDSVDGKILTNFCYINGTTTMVMKANELEPGTDSFTHVGMTFRFTNGRFEEISHNYMRSVWALLLLMAICSYIAQRSWRDLLRHDTLIALLKLPGNESLDIVKKAQDAHPYATLMNLNPDQFIKYTHPPTLDEKHPQPSHEKPKLAPMNEKLPAILISTVENLAGDSNEHNHTLDYYIDQLIWLLIARRASAYRLSELRLKKKLILHALCSTFMTIMQFVLPWLFIGDEYKLYGWGYFKLWLKYTLKKFRGESVSSMNSIDYKLSSYIWPTLAQCGYAQYGLHKPEHFTIQCSIPMNEISAKFFFVIWWFVMLNIIIEVFSLISLLLTSINLSLLRWSFGRRFWPHKRSQAKSIASFRFTRALLLQRAAQFTPRLQQVPKKQISDSNNQQHVNGAVPNVDLIQSRLRAQTTQDSPFKTMDERERKVFEATCDLGTSGGHEGPKKWYLWCSRDIRIFLSKLGKNMSDDSNGSKRRSLRDDEGFKENEENLNVYYLLYLLNLRLNCSRRKLEQIIQATDLALSRYLEILQRVDFGDGLSRLQPPHGGDREHLGLDNTKSMANSVVDVMM